MYIGAFLYDGYLFEYDLDTGDEVQHLKFLVMKTHQGGPAMRFIYTVDLEDEDGEWIANVRLMDEDGVGNSYVIQLEEDEYAYVQLGP